ncbi:ComF family protein [Bogoriella caseilytica]|uniref:ComF family protein n=1 Tax=Bogoriella caseilytica TaxID=56055 RepID=UPI0014758642|nr:phosphoribosyltransferase family protein [Bogoriella caseilytica]
MNGTGGRVQALLDLVLPRECVGCGRWDQTLCEDCAALFAGPPRRCLDLPNPSLPTWSAGPYRGARRAAVLAWKNHRRDCAAPLLQAAEVSAEHWAEDLDLRALLHGVTGPLLVLPAPSGWRRRWARRLVVADLADAVASGLATGLREAGLTDVGEILTADVLRRTGGRHHLAGAGRRERAAQRAGRMHLTHLLPAGTAALLIDDVVTTGATLAASAAALQEAGVQAMGAFTLVATPASGAGLSP